MNKRLIYGMLAATLVISLSACDGSQTPGAASHTNSAEPPLPPVVTAPIHDLSTAAEDGFEIEAGILKGYHGPNSEVVIPDAWLKFTTTS